MSKTRPGIITPREAEVGDTPAAAEPMWMGWAVIAGDGGWRRARVLLPESVVREYALEVFAPEVKAIVAARIEQDIVSDRLADRRTWEPKR